MIDDKKITLWTIIYDSDPELVYYFTDFNKVMASIEGSCYCYIMEEDNKEANIAISACMDMIRKLKDQPIIPVVFGNLQIMINKWELSQDCEIIKILLECYSNTEDTLLKERIEVLFANC
jgi:hypothetical protein